MQNPNLTHNPIKYVKPGGEPMKKRVLHTQKPSEKEKNVNIGYLSKYQLKKKLDSLPESSNVKRNINGKEGINKVNDYKHLPDAPKKKMS